MFWIDSSLPHGFAASHPWDLCFLNVWIQHNNKVLLVELLSHSDNPTCRNSIWSQSSSFAEQIIPKKASCYPGPAERQGKLCFSNFPIFCLNVHIEKSFIFSGSLFQLWNISVLWPVYTIKSRINLFLLPSGCTKQWTQTVSFVPSQGINAHKCLVLAEFEAQYFVNTDVWTLKCTEQSPTALSAGKCTTLTQFTSLWTISDKSLQVFQCAFNIEQGNPSL